MKNDEALFYKIEDYLKGKLPPDEAAALEQEIATDPALAEMVEMQRFEREGLEYMMGENLRAKIKDWETSPPLPRPVSTQSANRSNWSAHKKIWAGLLAIVLLGVAAFFLFRKNEPPVPPTQTEQIAPQDTTTQEKDVPVPPIENQPPIATDEKKPAEKQPTNDARRRELIALADASHQLPPGFFPDNLKGTDGTAKSPLAPAVEALRQTPPNYQKAIAEFSKIRQAAHPQDYDKAQEMLAHVYFKTGQYGKAAAIFQKRTEMGLPPALHDEAEWYLLLSLVPDYDGQKGRVDGLVEKMAGEGFHEYREEAIEVGKKLAGNRQ